jgi:hypothetical protein
MRAIGAARAAPSISPALQMKALQILIVRHDPGLPLLVVRAATLDDALEEAVHGFVRAPVPLPVPGAKPNASAALDRRLPLIFGFHYFRNCLAL